MDKRLAEQRLTTAELEILGVLWERGEATVREVSSVIQARRSVVYTGVLKLMQIMHDKGLVSRNEQDRAHIYTAIIARQEAEQQVLSEMSRTVFSGSVGRLAMRALEMDAATKDDLEAIRALISKKLQERLS